MSIQTFLTLWLGCLVSMLICRCVPLFVLRDRELPPRVVDTLGLIPVAAFAALVANDLFSPAMFDAGLMAGLIPLIASVVVGGVALKTRSLVVSAVVGVVAYALLLLVG